MKKLTPKDIIYEAVKISIIANLALDVILHVISITITYLLKN